MDGRDRLSLEAMVGAIRRRQDDSCPGWRQPLRALRRTAGIVAFAVGLASQVVSAQTITDGDVTFERTASSFDATPSGNLRGVTATLASDQMFETGWAFRVNGDTREFFFPFPSTQNFAGDTSTITWADVAGRGLFSARETVRVTDVDGLNGSSPAGRVDMTMELTNISPTPLTLGMFHLVDLDVAGDAADDVVALLRPGPNPTIGISDGVVSAQYRGIGANRWQVRAYAAGNGIGGLLDDAQLTTLGNTGAPGGPFDFTGGMQWTDRTIQPGASFSVSVSFVVNASVVEPELAVLKTNDVNGTASVDGIFQWTLLLINANHSPEVVFMPGQVLLRDQLPNADIVYDAAVVTPVGGTTGTVDCQITIADLICTATTVVTIPGAASVRVVLPAGPTAEGVFANPRPGGSCTIDPDGLVDEEVETNNACANTVTVVGQMVFADGFETP
jgi:hypothetical protein